MTAPHQQAEAELTAFGLTFPEAETSPGWSVTRALRIRGRSMFAVFGDKGEAEDSLTIIVKLPVSFEMVQDLPFVRESRGWFRQHQWAIAHFGPDDDILAELPTLKAWLRQSYLAVAPKFLGRRLTGDT